MQTIHFGSGSVRYFIELNFKKRISKFKYDKNVNAYSNSSKNSVGTGANIVGAGANIVGIRPNNVDRGANLCSNIAGTGA
jgi:hypothetical protein